MSKSNKQHKPPFKLVVSVFMQAPRPDKNTMVIIMLTILLIVVLLIAFIMPEWRAKAPELVISILQAIVTFFSAGSRNK